MSKSTLPDLFKNDLFAIKFHPEERPTKVGGRFTIYINRNSNFSPQKQQPIQKLRIASTAYTKSIYTAQTKTRSKSIHNLLPSNYQSTNNNTLKTKKSVAFVQSMKNSRRKSQFLLHKQSSTLQQIYYKNIMKNKKISEQQINVGFPNQTTRSTNNMKIQMEEADSMKNRVENIIEKQIELQKIFIQIKEQTQEIKDGLQTFKEQFIYNLNHLSLQFSQKFKKLSKKLSQSRRQTNQQTKMNLGFVQKLFYQIKDSESIINLMDKRSNVLRDECIEDQKIELTNSKTYSQDIYMRINNSLKQQSLDNLFGNFKRSRTSHEQRKRMSRNQSENERVQTTSYADRNKRRESNERENIEYIKNNRQDGMYETERVDDALGNQKIRKQNWLSVQKEELNDLNGEGQFEFVQ